jgi:5-methylcytosine-specific restriction protein A
MPGRIPTHRPPHLAPAARSYERQEDRREAIRWYQTEPWPSTRRAKLQQDPLCEPCLAQGRTTAAQQVHHRIDRRVRPDLAYDLGNLESVCIKCHNAKRAARTPQGG